MAKQIHEKVAPVITWLRTAEEESDDDEEDDEEVEVVYSEKASKTGLVTETIQIENVSNILLQTGCLIYMCKYFIG